MSFTYTFKFILVGDIGVGKSSLMLQFLQKTFRSEHEGTIGVQFGAKMIRIADNNIKLEVWDTAGQEAFKSITRGYYRQAAGIILVYDITNQKSFKSLIKWLQEAKLNGNPNMSFIILGNKCDMEIYRQITYEQGMNFAKQNDLEFLQVSAKTAFQVEEAFKQNAQQILFKINNGTIDPIKQPPGIKVGNIKSKNKLFISPLVQKQPQTSYWC